MRQLMVPCGGTMTTAGTHDDGDPSPDGLVIKSVTISTGGSGISTTTVAAGETTTETVYLDTLKYTVGTPSSFTAKEIKVVSSEDGTYRVTNVILSKVVI